jgi:hypothetical protein
MHPRGDDKMSRVTRTLQLGGDTGKVNRDEVRAVTIAIREGRTEDVLSGRVLQEFRAAAARRSRKSASTKSESAAA